MSLLKSFDRVFMAILRYAFKPQALIMLVKRPTLRVFLHAVSIGLVYF